MSSYMPAEWEEQDAIQLIWPSLDSDWRDNYNEATQCFLNIAQAICEDQLLIIIHKGSNNPKNHFSESELKNIILLECEYNDTWSRDIAPISVIKNNQPTLLNYQFNGWGNKFNHELDNALNNKLHKMGLFNNLQNIDFILEGGGVESNGKGTLLTTSNCLLNPNRNSNLSKEAIEKQIKRDFNLLNTIWLKNGKIKGDDTDSHIDTIARFSNSNTIIHTYCSDPKDVHYKNLEKLKSELEAQKEFSLIEIPLPTPIFDGERRLPATYANFLITNTKVLLPIYDVETDAKAIEVITNAFPNRKIITINCVPLIQQNGSLHCVTMQYAKGTINLSLKNGKQH